MTKEVKMAEKISLCDDCYVVQKDGTPCGIMFEKDVVESCSLHSKNASKHKTLADKYGPGVKKDAKEVK